MCVCRNCKKEIDKENAIPFGKSKYYCSIECLKAQHKPLERANDIIYRAFPLQQDEMNFQLFAVRWKKLLEMKRPDGNKMFTEEGIVLTIQYMIEIVGVEYKSDTSMYDLVPYYYNKAKEHWNRLSKNKRTKIENDNDVVYIRAKENKDVSLLKYKFRKNL